MESVSRARASRVGQMCGLLTVAFAYPLVLSLLILSGKRHPTPATDWQLICKIAYMGLSLFLLYAVLLRQGRTFSSIGFHFSPTWADFGHSWALFVGAIFVSTLTYGLLTYASYLAVGHGFPRWDDRAALFGTSVGGSAVCFVLLNPFFEELLVRAFLVTELQSFASKAVAVIASVALQSSYHLYQGFPNAIAISMSFLLFSLYFARKHRILPVILAHLYMDVSALLIYAHRVGAR